MSFPALRQPKKLKAQKNIDKYVILTLKNGSKLVINSDGYNGIVSIGEAFKCVFCCAELSLDDKNRETHIGLQSHKRLLEVYPHKEEYAENLIRQLSKDTCYCAICNVTMSTQILMRHLAADGHIEELKKAFIRADSYTATDLNNNK